VAFVPKTTVVKKWSQQVIMVKVPSTLAKLQRPIATLPLDTTDYGELDVLVCPTMAMPDKDGMLPVGVMNLQGQAVSIPMLTPIARFVIDPELSGIEVEFETADIMDKCHVGPKGTSDRKIIAETLSKRRSIFRSELGHSATHMQDASIRTKRIDSGEVQPPFTPAGCHNPKEAAALQTTLKKLLRSRLVEPTRSPFNARPILVKKPDGTFRMVIDWRKLNLETEKDTYPLPNIEANLAALGKANWFTTLDLLQGFHQVMLNGADGSRAKTAFSVENGQYQFTRMPMGLTSSPGAFMRLVDACLRGLPAGIALAYV
jgi:hypothetical protein